MAVMLPAATADSRRSRCNKRPFCVIGHACFCYVEPVTGLEEAGLAVSSLAQELIAGFPGTKLKAPDCSGASDGSKARPAWLPLRPRDDYLDDLGH